MKKEHLGDGIYAQFDKGKIILTLEDGGEIIDCMIIKPEVAVALLRYFKNISETKASS